MLGAGCLQGLCNDGVERPGIGVRDLVAQPLKEDQRRQVARGGEGLVEPDRALGRNVSVIGAVHEGDAEARIAAEV